MTIDTLKGFFSQIGACFDIGKQIFPNHFADGEWYRPNIL